MEKALEINSSNNKKAALYMFIAASSISVSGFFAKLCQLNSIPLSITIFARFSIPLIILSAFFVSSRKLSEISLKNINIHIVRALFLTLSQTLFFLAIIKLSLAEATILYSTGPLFMALHEIFSKNKITTPIIISLLLGAAGVCLMLHIQDGSFNLYVLVGLFSGFCLAGSQILLHQASQNEKPLDIMFFIYLFSTIFSVFLLFINFPSETIISNLQSYDVIIFLILVGIFSILNQLFRGMAYSLVDSPSSLSPIIYFSVFVSIILDGSFFKHSINIETISGGILILIGSYLSMKNKIKNI